jgi:hypothetical protein
MSRSGYSDECDGWASICWRGAVTSALRGQRGQAFLKELVAALDAMPEKVLAADSLVNAEGEFCTLGVVGAARGMDLGQLDPEDYDQVAKAFGLAPAMVREIVFENDEGCIAGGSYEWFEVCGPLRRLQQRHRSVWVPDPQAGAKRWAAMRRWAEQQINRESS